MNSVIDNVRQELLKNSEAKFKLTSQNFFKEKVQFYGVRTSTVGKISKEQYRSLKDSSKNEIFDLCDIFWQSIFIEETFIACQWSYFVHKQYKPEDFEIFEKWVNLYVNNWASCDTLCNHTVEEFLTMYPEFISRLKIWAKSSNRWVRRAAAVSLIIPARHGKFLKEILEIADILLLDSDDLVQKGYGWMLKAASQAHQKEIFEYVLSKKSVMPRTALRYAIEKMPGELKAEAMKK